jgi:hypothetical protein
VSASEYLFQGLLYTLLYCGWATPVTLIAGWFVVLRYRTPGWRANVSAGILYAQTLLLVLLIPAFVWKRMHPFPAAGVWDFHSIAVPVYRVALMLAFFSLLGKPRFIPALLPLGIGVAAWWTLPWGLFV